RAPCHDPGPVPLYVQVSDDIRQAIADGAYERTLPGYRALADEHGVSAITLRRALETLEAKGLIAVRQGRGTFITPAGRRRAGHDTARRQPISPGHSAADGNGLQVLA